MARTLPNFCVVLCIFVLFYVFLCCSMYFCVVLCIVSFVMYSVLSVCICVLNYCHRVATQLQLTNISYHIIHIQYIIKLFNGLISNLSILHNIQFNT